MLHKTAPEKTETMEVNAHNKLKIISGTVHPELAAEIAKYLFLNLTPVTTKKFSDGETFVRVDESVRGCDVFVIQPTCSPVNESLMELLITIDALKRASAATINIVVPYYGYARQDRKAKGREAITAKLVADMIGKAGADRVIAMDLHSGQLQGFFDVKVDHLNAIPVILNHIQSKNYSDIVVVSPDTGGVARASELAKRLNAPIAIVDKRRPDHNQAEVFNVIGDVKGKVAILLDDMIDTGGTICKASDKLKEEGATQVIACATHPVFSGQAIYKLASSSIDEIVVTNTIPLAQEAKLVHKITQLSVANIFGEAISRIYNEESVSDIFS